ncbi:unnamed protein product [Schistosoma turkestanicum]|nr:unnamed protein product [Schistosoma turkestanicum]
MSFDYNNRHVTNHDMQFLLNLRFDESVCNEFLPVSFVSSRDKLWKLYKQPNEVNSGREFYQERKVTKITVPKTDSKRKVYNKPQICSQNSSEFTVKG